jgi:hypothetical protein
VSIYLTPYFVDCVPQFRGEFEKDKLPPKIIPQFVIILFYAAKWGKFLKGRENLILISGTLMETREELIAKTAKSVLDE